MVLKSPTAKVTSVNSKTGAFVLTTDDVNEGSTNQYYTGEIGVEIDTGKTKIGDGKSNWKTLNYTHTDILFEDIDNLFK